MLRRHGSCREFGLVFRYRDHVPARYPGGSLSKLCFSIVPALVSTAMIVVNSSYISTDVVEVKSELGFLGLKGGFLGLGVGGWGALRGWGCGWVVDDAGIWVGVGVLCLNVETMLAAVALGRDGRFGYCASRICLGSIGLRF